MTRTLLIATVMLCLGASPSEPKAVPAGAPKAARELPSGLPKPDYLSELARQVLQRRMERHGKDVSVLVQAVVLLQRDIAAELASAIAAEPRLVRPIAGGQDDLNAALPEKFFVYQDELRDRAKALATAARSKNDAQLAEALGRLTQTCVNCHSAYLSPAPK